MQNKLNYYFFELILIAVLNGFFFHDISFAQISPEVPSDLEFKVLNTPHFEIIYDSKHKDLAEANALRLEKVYKYLSGFLTARPEKTVVVLNDKTDSTNGYATRIPYPLIVVYPVLQPSLESISESGDWPLELLSHEYTHILSFEPIGENIRFLRTLFGSIISPNILMPLWWKEGIAVQIETAISDHGRLRSKYQDAILRSFANNKTLLQYSLAEANESFPIWPEGARPYIFGSLIWSQMIADQGNKSIEYLFKRHSERAPYFINTPAEELFGKNYASQFAKTLREVDVRVKKQMAELQKSKFTLFTSLSNKYKYTSNPSISPNGKWLGLIAVDENKKRSLKFFRRNPKFGQIHTAKSKLSDQSKFTKDSPKMTISFWIWAIFPMAKLKAFLNLSLLTLHPLAAFKESVGFIKKKWSSLTKLIL